MKKLLLCLLFLLPITSHADILDNYNKYAQLIANAAISLNFDPKIAIYIADQESHMRPDAVGDHGTSFGLFQIHLPAHTDITKKQATDPYFAIYWAVSQLAKGNCRIWSTCPTDGT